MTDEEMLVGAKVVAAVLLRAEGTRPIAEAIDPANYFEETQDFICLVQQIIAEATGLVGTGDI